MSVVGRAVRQRRTPVPISDTWRATYPLSGHLFVFRGRRSDILKIIWHDGLGACLFTRRLEKGRFIWPNMEGGAVAISPAQLSYLLSGIDWRNPQDTWRPTRVG
nr:IS66 family insertion sequence element accessory protein TnpB [Sinorhizobium meliloti]